MKLQIFNGGLNTRTAPQMVGVEESVVFDNVDSAKGNLTPLADAVVFREDAGSNPFYFVADDEIVTSARRRSYVEFQSFLYWTDGATRPQRYKDGVSYNLGISSPSGAPDVTSIEALDRTTEFTTTTEDAPDQQNSGLLPGTHYYLIVNETVDESSDAIYFSIDDAGNSRVLDQNLRADPETLSIRNGALDNISTRKQNTISNVQGITIENANVYRLYQGRYRLVGTLLTDQDEIIDGVEDISAADEFDFTNFLPLSGTYQYAYTYYSTITGFESAQSPITEEVDLTNGGIVNLTLVSSDDAQVDKIRIYRIGGNLTSFSLVEEIDNTQTTYEDRLADNDINGRVLDTQEAQPALASFNFLTEHNSMLFAADGSRLRFTPIGFPEQWPDLFFIEIREQITGIGPTSNGLLVFTRFRTYLITGTSPEALALDLLSEDQGCASHFSVQSIAGEAIWASLNGICASSGNLPTLISQTKLGQLKFPFIQDSVVFDECYYLLLNDDTALVLDMRFHTHWRTLAVPYDSFVLYNNRLLGHRVNTLSELFSAEQKLSMSYRSPRYVEGSMTEQKTYKKVYIYSEGDIIFNIFIDNELVSSKQLSGVGATQVQVPQDKQRGFFIEFEVKGTGIVEEIEYTVTRRQND